MGSFFESEEGVPISPAAGPAWPPSSDAPPGARAGEGRPYITQVASAPSRSMMTNMMR